MEQPVPSLEIDAQNQAERQRVGLRTAKVALLAAVALVLPSPAQAATPPTPEAVPTNLPDVTNTHRSDFAGPGAQISNQGSGYYLGRIINNKDQFMQTIQRKSRLWVFGLIDRYNSNEPSSCGVIEAKVVSDKDAVYGNLNDPCTPLIGDMKQRDKIGKGFNGGPGKYVDGALTYISSSPSCDLAAWYNYASDSKGFDNLTYPQTRGGFYDYARPLAKGEKIYYRYTKLDGKAAIVRIDVKNDQGGWVVVDKDCINGYPQGGTLKTSSTQPGANPNQATESKKANAQ